MTIDLTKIKEPGYLDSLLYAEIDNEWNTLVREKLNDSSPPDLETMKTIWSHGFTKGAEAYAKLSEEILKAAKSANKQ